jgi:hypothetical protein
VALFGLFHKMRLHYIGINYTTPDGKSGGILLQGDKDNYRAMLVALQGVSGVPVSVSEGKGIRSGRCEIRNRERNGNNGKEVNRMDGATVDGR